MSQPDYAVRDTENSALIIGTEGGYTIDAGGGHEVVPGRAGDDNIGGDSGSGCRDALSTANQWHGGQQRHGIAGHRGGRFTSPGGTDAWPPEAVTALVAAMPESRDSE